MKAFLKKHPVLFMALLGIILLVVAAGLISGGPDGFLGGIVICSLLAAPIVLSIINIVFIFKRPGSKAKLITFEILSMLLGVVLTFLLIPLLDDIVFTADWNVQLYNIERHAPLNTQASPTFLTFCFVGLVGYLFLSFSNIAKKPPLVIVCAISAIYIGSFELIMWIVQLSKASGIELLLIVLPANLLIIYARTIALKLKDWKEKSEPGTSPPKNEFVAFLNLSLQKVSLWPLWALLLVFPLAGIIMCLLLLFGQQPDCFIKVFTETSDWALSQKISPQNVMRDEHYLCTVAAGGHKKVVKPLRMGVRHNHKIVVNRQLLVANAFEQVLEERLPKFHRKLRHFYDKYGFPICRLIKSKVIADIIYFMMKPLEWFFVAALYFVDVNPENRIAIQYLPSKNFKKH